MIARSGLGPLLIRSSGVMGVKGTKGERAESREKRTKEDILIKIALSAMLPLQ